jgi:hypothetical protein
MTWSDDDDRKLLEEFAAWWAVNMYPGQRYIDTEAIARFLVERRR